MKMVSKLHTRVLVCTVEREGKVYIPNGEFVLRDGDLISIMATPQDASDFFVKLGVSSKRIHNTLIVGGGAIAVYLTRRLQEMGIDVHIVEIDPKRCEALAQQLPHATILNGDGADQDFLLSVGLERAESFVAITNMDEENLLLALFAKKNYSPIKRLSDLLQGNKPGAQDSAFSESSGVFEQIEESTRCGDELMQVGVADDNVARKDSVHILSGRNQIAGDMFGIRWRDHDRSVWAFTVKLFLFGYNVCIVFGKEREQFIIEAFL